MGWEELERHSLSDPRDQQIAMEISAITELGRYPTEPYPVKVVAGGIAREPNTLIAVAGAPSRTVDHLRLARGQGLEIVGYLIPQPAPCRATLA
jgi:hypothetical protein